MSQERQPYAQVGGDNGNACGKYQFDYRYSLLPFVKYCYESNPTFFAEFKKYGGIHRQSEVITEGKHKVLCGMENDLQQIAERHFASYQDAYAKREYYDVTARYLQTKFNINMDARPDIVKGAVFSYSIQHGQWTAAFGCSQSSRY